MAPNPRLIDERLQALYDQLPALECRGMCHDTCGPVPVTIRERERMERASGKEFTCGALATCSMLTSNRTCGVYEIRPLLCRLWGVIESLPCHYGCKPEYYLTDKQGWALLLEANRIAGSDTPSRELAEMIARVQEMPPEQIKMLARALTPKPRLKARDAALPKTILHRR